MHKECETGHSDECGDVNSTATLNTIKTLISEFEEEIEAASKSKITPKQQTDLYEQLDRIGFYTGRLILESFNKE
ncbi:MAG: hypothetical protein GY941_13665 [Planctomycetes bacterium]|nr:hypothetical protein [Planctomycetota bacterium]